MTTRTSLGRRTRASWLASTSVAALAFATAAGCSTPSDPLVVSLQRPLTVSASQQFSVSVPNQLQPQAVVADATTSLQLDDRAVLAETGGGFAISAGVGATGLSTGTDVSIGTLWSVGPVVLRDRAHVHGDVNTTSTLSRGNQTIVDGAINLAPVIQPLAVTSWTVNFPGSSAGNVNLAPGAQRTLAPGGYDAVTLNAGATLRLSSGTYFFQSLDVEPQARISLTATPTAPVFIYVVGNIMYRGTIVTGSGQTPNLLLGALTNQPIFIESPFTGTLVAPNASVTVRATGDVGAFFAKSLEIGAGVTITHQAFPWQTLTPTVGPIAASPGTTIGTCDTLTLTAPLASPDPDVSFNWAVTSAPAGASFTFVNNNTNVASLSSETAGKFLVSVAVFIDGGQTTLSIPITIVAPGSCSGTQSRPSNSGSAPPVMVTGAPFPPFVPPGENDSEPHNPSNGINVPTGPVRGPVSPIVGGTAPQQPPPLGGSGGPVVFVSNNPYTNTAGNPPDISGAQSSKVVFATVNTFARYSTDGGTTFNTINPTTVFPSAASKDATGKFLDNGLCCDQVIQYVPSINRFIWLQQFCGTGASCLQGLNRMRIASASPEDIIASNGTSWTYWDLLQGTFTGYTVGTMDYPDLSVGDNYLYMSVDSVGAGLLVVRIPLTEIRDSQTIHFNYTNPPDSQTAYGAHLSQNTGNQIFWGGHINNSTMRIFSWPESSGSYSWRSVSINTWPNCNNSSLGSDGTTNWLSFGFPGTAPIGVTVVPTEGPSEIWFSWMAGRGRLQSDGTTCGSNDFPQPHIQIARIDASSFSFIGQQQVWNASFAFAYPSLAVNSDGEVGMSLLWGGGGTFDTTHAVGMWGDFVVWNTGTGSASVGRNGDYLAVRQAGSNSELFAAFGYNVIKNTPPATGSHFDPRYVLFGRNSVVNPN
jgi:hypothetical protein